MTGFPVSTEAGPPLGSPHRGPFLHQILLCLTLELTQHAGVLYHMGEHPLFHRVSKPQSL